MLLFAAILRQLFQHVVGAGPGYFTDCSFAEEPYGLQMHAADLIKQKIIHCLPINSYLK